jgi:four helix bundle protein
MAGVGSFRELIVWQKAMVFVTATYKVTQAFPASEQFGLTSQHRRSAVSVPSNIAEGYGRRSNGDFIRFLQIALGSLFEVQTQLQIAHNLDFLSGTMYDTLLMQSVEIEKMLASLIQKVRAQK